MSCPSPCQECVSRPAACRLPGSLAELALVPEQVLGAEDLFPELRDSLVHAFLTLEERYRCRLQAVQDRLQGPDRYCGDYTSHLFPSVLPMLCYS